MPIIIGLLALPALLAGRDTGDVNGVAQGNCNFGLERSDGEWRFTTWYDLVGYRLLSESTTWGAIKARG
jgi:hypothetical protein